MTHQRYSRGYQCAPVGADIVHVPPSAFLTFVLPRAPCPYPPHPGPHWTGEMKSRIRARAYETTLRSLTWVHGTTPRHTFAYKRRSLMTTPHICGWDVSAHHASTATAQPTASHAALWLRTATGWRWPSHDRHDRSRRCHGNTSQEHRTEDKTKITPEKTKSFRLPCHVPVSGFSVLHEF